MKKYISLTAILLTMTFFLIACSENNKTNKSDDNTENSQTEDKKRNADKNSDTDAKGIENDRKESDEISSSNDNTLNSIEQSKDKENIDSKLSRYSSEEIEYARVWLQLGENQEIDKLYAEKISSGMPMNPDDETSMNYPKNVVQLSGIRLVDGVVTYSSNADGTIHVYKVPKRWDGKNPAGEDVYKKIIDHAKQVTIDSGDDQKVEEFIKILQINS